jgi:hypothetical protein
VKVNNPNHSFLLFSFVFWTPPIYLSILLSIHPYRIGRLSLPVGLLLKITQGFTCYMQYVPMYSYAHMCMLIIYKYYGFRVCKIELCFSSVIITPNIEKKIQNTDFQRSSFKRVFSIKMTTGDDTDNLAGNSDCRKNYY